ncbi:MAG: WD40/YVTN/BNR-like repeat-containing protein [Myxococcaceae bacterium]
MNCHWLWCALAATLVGCAGTSSTGNEGNSATGSAGPAGSNAVIAMGAEPAGANCANGGTVVAAGLDSNANGVLDADEVKETKYVCNGAAGAAGTAGSSGSQGDAGEQGPKGDAGADGYSMLMTFTSVGPGAQCAAGGTRVDAGLDLDRDSVLDPGEITATSNVCNGGANPWVNVTTAAAQASSNTNYLASNADAGVTTVTLPASPVVGDVVQISGAGPGGWRLAICAGARVDMGTSAEVASTSASFVNQNLPAESYNPFAVNANGNTAYVGSTQRIRVTHDSGKTWSTSLNTAGNWRGIATTPDGATAIAVGQPNLIQRTTDRGTTWAPIAGATGQFESVSISDDGRVILIGIDFGGGGLLVSTDAGGSFTTVAGLPAGGQWVYTSASPTGKVLTATQNATQPGNKSVISKDFGATWTVLTTPASMYELELSADGSTLFGAVSSPAAVFTSRDMGVTWVRRLNFAPVRIRVSGKGDTLVACQYAGQTAISFNGGMDWANGPGSGSTLWYGCGVSRDGSTAFIGDANSSGSTVHRVQRTWATTTTTGTAGFLSGPQFSGATVQFVGSNTWLLTGSSGTLGTN